MCGRFVVAKTVGEILTIFEADEIVGNIKSIGLKKPITVTPRPGPDGAERYMLICGEGRMKAFQSLGEKTIPALVVDVTDENAYIMSLAENIARRQYRPLELLAGIEQLQAIFVGAACCAAPAASCAASSRWWTAS